MVEVRIDNEMSVNGNVGCGINIEGLDYDKAKALAESIMQTLRNGYKYPTEVKHTSVNHNESIADTEDEDDEVDEYDIDNIDNFATLKEIYDYAIDYLYDVLGDNEVRYIADIASNYADEPKGSFKELISDTVYDEICGYLEQYDVKFASEVTSWLLEDAD